MSFLAILVCYKYSDLSPDQPFGCCPTVFRPDLICHWQTPQGKVKQKDSYQHGDFMMMMMMMMMMLMMMMMMMKMMMMKMMKNLGGKYLLPKITQNTTPRLQYSSTYFCFGVVFCVSKRWEPIAKFPSIQPASSMIFSQLWSG